MALTVTASQILANVRRITDTAGTNGAARHADAHIYDYINRALGSLHRKLTEALPDERYLSSTTVSLTSGTTTYSLPADFDHLISVDLTANGVKRWLVAYEMSERPALSDPSATFTGIPFAYRLRGSNVEYLPSPTSSYSSTLWYVPTPTQWSTSGSDASSTFDTINRLDDYLIAYAGRFVAMRDKNFDLAGTLKAMCDELEAEIYAIGRSRDKNSPSRIVDESAGDRFGRTRWLPRRWR